MNRTFCLLLISASLLLLNCSPRLALKKGIYPGSIGICLNYNPNIDNNYEIPRYFDSTLSVFIKDYNLQKHPFKLSGCINKNDTSLIIYIQKTQLINPSKQATAIAVSAMGLALPFIMVAADLPFWIAFVYLPENNTEAEIYLTLDISGISEFTQKRDFKSNPYFGSLNSQKTDHSEKFYDFLSHLIRELERSYRRNLKE